LVNQAQIQRRPLFNEGGKHENNQLPPGVPERSICDLTLRKTLFMAIFYENIEKNGTKPYQTFFVFYLKIKNPCFLKKTGKNRGGMKPRKPRQKCMATQK